MPRTKSVQDQSLLEAALEGLELQKQRVEEQIEHVRSLLGRNVARRGRPPLKEAAQPATKKRNLSPAARKRIAAAQKRRWAQFRKETPEPAE